MAQKTALITGVTGQDGSYLAELLLEKGYRVVGMVRRASSENNDRISHLLEEGCGEASNILAGNNGSVGQRGMIDQNGVRRYLELRQGDLLDQLSLITLIDDIKPDEIYNLAAQSFVPTSWEQPVLTGEYTALGVTRVLEAVRLVNPKIRVYQASSSEMYGRVRETPQSELTPFYPRSPYGVAKAYGHYITVNYRESYDIFAVSGILFNHESPRRGLEFVTRKVTDGVARIHAGVSKELRMGNLDARRDWGFAGDYVKAMWLMLQQDQADDYVIATGTAYSVKELVETAFTAVGLDWEKFVVTDPRFIRPAEVDLLIGDASHAKNSLSWVPEVDFKGLIKMMVEADIARYNGSYSNRDYSCGTNPENTASGKSGSGSDRGGERSLKAV